MNEYLSELKRRYRKNVTSEEIFLSKRLVSYLQNMAQLVSGRYGQKINVDVKYDISINDLAYTNNHVVVINANHLSLSKQPDDKRYNAIIGLLAHELGHILYTDFAFFNQISTGVLSNDLTCIERYLAPVNPAIRAAAMNHPKGFVRMFKQVLNIMEDRYVEHEIVKRYSGSFKKGLETVSLILAPTTTIDTDIYNLIWYQCMYELSDMAYEEKPALKSALDIVMQVNDTHNFGLRVGLVFDYINCLWEYLQEQFDESEQPQDEPDNEHPNAEHDDDTGESENKTPDSKPLSSSQRADFVLDGCPADPDIADGNGVQENETSLPAMSFAVFVDEMINENLKDESVRQTIDVLIESDICSQISDIPFHENVSAITINIKPEPTDIGFRTRLAECKAISKRLQKRVIESVLERERGTRINGLSMGRRIDGRAVARGDTKLFTKAIYPDKKPLLSVAVVLDESGSMCGERILQTQKAALVLEDFCRNLNVPLLLIGHTENGSCNVEIRNYIGFNDQRKKSDANKLAQVKSRSNNRDGFAIRYALNKIAKRKERHRVIIVVSDGRPCAAGYSYSTGKADIQNCIADAKRHGIAVIGVAIGEDMDQLSEIYGKGLVDARNLATLPNALTNILVKMLK